MCITSNVLVMFNSLDLFNVILRKITFLHILLILFVFMRCKVRVQKRKDL
ncbi:hypothetical protein BANRA_03135 [Escherichia coli]|nr:hypothetical protein BANRA_03135 [Escherichia coli]